MGLNIYSGILKRPEFNSTYEDEFTKTMQCEIAGINKEDIEFEYKSNNKLDNNEEFALSIYGCSNNPRIKNCDISFGIHLNVNRKEYYGYDYFVDNGILTLILYKTYKTKIGLFNDKPMIKYIRKPMEMC